jgi:hypothetical protein
MRERLREIIEELRELAERAQASIDNRPVLQAALSVLRKKITEAKDETEKPDADDAA